MAYLDRTFCISPECENECGRQLTQDIRDAANEAGIPISVANFCNNDESK